MNKNNGKVINVNMSGEQYIAHEKWKAEQQEKNKVKLTTAQKTIIISTIAVVLVVCMIMGIIEGMTPSDPVKFTWDGVGMFLAICGGVGWVIHGTGFLLVRR